jgi:hypothetical protein
MRANARMWRYILLCLVEMQYQNQKQGLGSVWGSKARVGELTGVAVISIPVSGKWEAGLKHGKGSGCKQLVNSRKNVGTIDIIGTWFWRAHCQEVPKNQQHA